MVRVVILRIFESYFRHRWLYLLPILILTAAGVAFVLLSKPKYVAGGVMYVQKESYLASLTDVRDIEGTWWTTPSQATAQEVNDLLRTNAFVRSVIQQTDLEQDMDKGPDIVGSIIEDVRKSIWTATQGDNQLFFGAATDEPNLSYQLVNAVIEAYLQWRINGQRAQSEAAHEFLTGLIEQYQADLDAARSELSTYLAAHSEPLRGERPAEEALEIDRLRGQLNLASQRYAGALDKDENALLSLAQIESDARQTYVLIDAPRLPDRPEISRKELALQLGIFLASGVLLSLVLIIGSALLDRTFRFPTDIQPNLNLPVLALVPRLLPVKKGKTAQVFKEIPAPQSTVAEAQTAATESRTLGADQELPTSENYHTIPKTTP